MDHDITQILLGWDNNREGALNQLTPLVYHELHRLAASYLRRERPDHALQPTALIHEAYLRMVKQDGPTWKDRAHFFGVAAQVMRQILVDFARRHKAEKRGGGRNVQLDDKMQISAETAGDFLDLNEALDKLKTWDERKCKVIELRYFGGLQREEIAEALGVSLATVKRDLSIAEAYLRREISAPAPV